MFSSDVVLFDVAERHWATIRKPRREDPWDSTWAPTQCLWKLTGHDTNVVLVHLKDISMWKLNEDEEYSWSELQAFPRILYRHDTTTYNHLRWLRFKHPEVIVNSCGWVLLLMHGSRFVMFDGKGRMELNSKLKLERCYAKSDYRMSLHAYEINNIW
ncbi:hypothetical protein SUGI_0474040 [Cryptomeria japonica]|nr:hypothetical protein SUGI_0474040 [Cryptomeria japonica]